MQTTKLHANKQTTRPRQHPPHYKRSQRRLILTLKLSCKSRLLIFTSIAWAAWTETLVHLDASHGLKT